MLSLSAIKTLFILNMNFIGVFTICLLVVLTPGSAENSSEEKNDLLDLEYGVGDEKTTVRQCLIDKNVDLESLKGMIDSAETDNLSGKQKFFAAICINKGFKLMKPNGDWNTEEIFAGVTTEEDEKERQTFLNLITDCKSKVDNTDECKLFTCVIGRIDMNLTRPDLLDRSIVQV